MYKQHDNTLYFSPLIIIVVAQEYHAGDAGLVGEIVLVNQRQTELTDEQGRVVNTNSSVISAHVV